MAEYFKKLPIIEYQGTFVRDITSRVGIRDSDSIHTYYDYEIKEGDKRPDVIADKYYDDPVLSWMIFLGNKVIDPYMDLGLVDADFNAYIVDKYGSQINAMETVLFYQNDWRSDDSILTLGQYDALPGDRKKYYQPVFDYNDQISGYDRIKEDWIVNNNRTVYCTVEEHDFKEGDRLTQGPNQGVLVSANSTYLLLEKIEGEFQPNTAISSNTASALVIDTGVLAHNIPLDEYVYWTPVNALDWEREQNEQKKKIKLIDNRLTEEVEKQLEDLLG